MPISDDVNLWPIALVGAAASILAGMGVFRYRRRHEAQYLREFVSLRSVEVSHSREETVTLVGARLTDRQALVVARWDPNLATQRGDRLAYEVATHLVIPHHDVSDMVGVASVELRLRPSRRRGVRVGHRH